MFNKTWKKRTILGEICRIFAKFAFAKAQFAIVA
jgi:hypothetical protein